MQQSKIRSLNCINCGRKYPLKTQSRCESCNGILTAYYSISKDIVSYGKEGGIWRFSQYLPPVNIENKVSLGEGSTPYIRAEGYAEEIGLDELWFKLEYLNPTGSFKDRAAALGLSLAKEWGYVGVFTASSGNAAAATSAYSARANTKCLILIRDDVTSQKISQIAMYSPFLIRVKSLFDSRKKLEEALRLTQSSLPKWFNHFFWAPYNPLLVDAFKTISFEMILENPEVPRYLFVPVAGGDLIYGLYKGFREMYEADMIRRIPALVAVQGEGANPTILAIERGLESVPEIKRADTIAGALRVNFGAEHSLLAVRGSGGFGISVTDEEILEAQKGVAKLEGIFCETSSAAAIAAVKKAKDKGFINRNEPVAVVITGLGFKDFELPINDESTIPTAKSVDEIPEAINRFINTNS